MHGEVQLPGTLAPGPDKYESGLRHRSADFERSWKLTSIAASAAPLAASWQAPTASKLSATLATISATSTGPARAGQISARPFGLPGAVPIACPIEGESR